MIHRCSLICAASALVFGGSSHGQQAVVNSRIQAVNVDSGWVVPSGRTSGPEVVFARDVSIAGAAWMRLTFDQTSLPGIDGSGAESRLVLTASDGASQVFNARKLAEWSSASAYFNGSTVRVELLSFPGAAPARVSVGAVEFGVAPGPDAERTVCGSTDERTLATDARVGRLMPQGCTAFLIDDANHTLLTAGHCAPAAGSVVQFNVPLSNPDGGMVFPPPESQFAVDASSVQFSQLTLGDDWTYFGCFANANTGLTPYQAQGACFYRAGASAPTTGQQCRVTGYGTVTLPLPLSWNYALKTAVGAYLALAGSTVSYDSDTTGGNSGSPVINESNGKVIAIHTSGGCTATGGANAGTAMQAARLQSAFAWPKGVCGSGVSGTPGGPLFAIGDAANNLGTINRSSGQFARMTAPTSHPSGLGYRRSEDTFYALDASQRLVRVSPATWNPVTLGPLLNAPATVTDLSCDPRTDQLLGLCQSSGQLVAIDKTTRVVSTLTPTPPTPGNLAGLAVVTSVGQILAIDNAPSAGGGTRLVSINRVTGQRSTIGALGQGLTNCTTLVWCDDTRSLYTIDADSQRLFRIDRTTGAAAPVGGTGATWTTGGGMAYRRLENVCLADVNLDGAVNSTDLSQLLLRWGQSLIPGTGGDLNADGTVNTSDLVLLVASYGCQP